MNSINVLYIYIMVIDKRTYIPDNHEYESACLAYNIIIVMFEFNATYIIQ